MNRKSCAPGLRCSTPRSGRIFPTAPCADHTPVNTPFFNQRGEIVGTFGVSRDITPLHEAKERLQKTTDLLAKAGRIARLGHWQVDASGKPDRRLQTHGLRWREGPTGTPTI
jgi:hypothetical protein